jgi:hypothetical protein
LCVTCTMEFPLGGLDSWVIRIARPMYSLDDQGTSVLLSPVHLSML